MEPDDRYEIARNLGRNSHQIKDKYWWLFHLIAPISRLPFELLQHILLIIIDKVGDPPLVLMLVCKLWYAMVTGIWALLRLGTRTAADAIMIKLERNQWLLDILVDTEIDRGDSTPSEGAYEAISQPFRSLKMAKHRRLAGLPEQLINHGLQRCSSAAMSRLRTFKLKRACEMSQLLDRLFLGTTASKELATFEIYSANVMSFLCDNC